MPRGGVLAHFVGPGGWLGLELTDTLITRNKKRYQETVNGNLPNF